MMDVLSAKQPGCHRNKVTVEVIHNEHVHILAVPHETRVTVGADFNPPYSDIQLLLSAEVNVLVNRPSRLLVRTFVLKCTVVP